MAKQKITDVAFYITNACGMACDGCVSFNNYILKGHYDWNTSADRINKWGELLDIEKIAILGGEPFLHPHLTDWSLGIKTAFPNCKDIRIVTGLTGQKLLRYKDIAKVCIENGIAVQISVHDPSWWENSEQTAEEILDGVEYTKEHTVDGGDFPLRLTKYKSVNGTLLFALLELWAFFPSAKKEVKDGIMYLHNNDAELAHSACHCKSQQYIVDGKMFKCAVTSVADTMVKQLPLDERSKNLLLQVHGIDPFDNPKLDFSQAIPQCSLCSVNMDKLIPIYPIDIKKPKI
jgi:hypothetical protein|tara:strand:+ start:6097 stop:6963 length:867 start_codon:yes stop_codon:yes gene_type:complete